MNEKIHTRIALIKGQIIHCPESTQVILEELKERAERLKANNSELETMIKSKEKEYSNLLFLCKLVNEYEAIIMDLDKAYTKSHSLNTNIEELNESKAKKEKLITEKESHIDTINKSLSNIDEYLNEYILKQKKNIESKDEFINSEREKLNRNIKRLAECNKLVQDQLESNANIESNVYTINIDISFGTN